MSPLPVVVVTGAGAGLGRAITRRFAARGAAIGLLSRGRDALDGALKEAASLGGEAMAVPTDVAEPEQVESAASEIEHRFGAIDIWVNNAMTSVFAPFTQIAADEFERVIDVTFHGYVNGTRAALQRMRPRDRGTIVQVGSALAYRGIPLQSAYCAAKHAIEGFTESIRTELLHEHSRIRITMVQMPALNTPQFDWVLARLPRGPRPVPPIYQPEIGAEAVVHAALHPRREIWVGGSTIATILANRIAPGLVDRYLGRTGYDAQQTDDARDPDQPVNLWQAVPGDHGSHGGFDRIAHDSSPALWVSRHRRWLVAGVVATALTAARGGARVLRRRARG
jgi:NAD(P)-dependent dehydrogenase (short-subunit alcohol dehydrogenase family)